jgi:hypothetical protein
MGYGIEQGLNGWQDPRTGMWFANEAIAISLGYGKPVDMANTIVQVGSQGSFTQDGRLVTTADLVAPGANNAGYVGLAAGNLLNTNPNSDASYARDWMSSYQDFLSNTGTVLAKEPAKQLASYPSSPQMVEVWKNVPALTPSAMVNYNTPNQSPGSTNEPPNVNMISPGQTVGTQESTGIVSKAVAAVTGYGLYIVGGIVLLVLLVFMSRGFKTGVTS